MGTIFACVALMSRYYLRGLGSTIAGTIRRGWPLGRLLGLSTPRSSAVPCHPDADRIAVFITTGGDNIAAPATATCAVPIAIGVD